MKDLKIIKHFEIPDSVEKIGERAFEDCTNLKSINLPKKFENIIKTFGIDENTKIEFKE